MGNKKIYRYPENLVDINNINVEPKDNKEYRYLLEIPISNDIKDVSALFIMKNPSNGNKDQSDKTLNNIINFSKSRYSKIYIANLYPFVASEPKEISKFRGSEFFEQEIEKNLEVLNDLISEKGKYNRGKITDIIYAWGSYTDNLKGQSDFDERIEEVKDIVRRGGRKAMAVRFSSSTNPWHPRNWEGNYTLELYEWES